MEPSPALLGTKVLDWVLPKYLLRPGNAGAGGLSISGSLHRRLRQNCRGSCKLSCSSNVPGSWSLNEAAGSKTLYLHGWAMGLSPLFSEKWPYLQRTTDVAGTGNLHFAFSPLNLLPWFRGALGSPGVRGVLDDLEVLFQPGWCCDSMREVGALTSGASSWTALWLAQRLPGALQGEESAAVDVLLFPG